MKRVLIILFAFVALTLAGIERTYAQGDDVYYDPDKDKANQNNQPAYNPGNNPTPQSGGDQTDGYGNPAYNYDGKDNSYAGTGILDDGDYYTEEDDYQYTSRMRRFYTPNYGVDYYSYWFTPSFYMGWNAWNGGMVVSASPWYRDPWWGWNRGYRTTAMFGDPFYDPYWSYNWGWNSNSYMTSWNYPYGGYYGRCSYYGLGYSYGFGYNPWSYGYGYGGFGYGGGCYGGYNTGYWGGGYNNGYYHGFNDGYYANSYNSNHRYYNPRHRMAINQGGRGITTSNSGGMVRGSVNNNNGAPGRNPENVRGEIPRGGLVQPTNTPNRGVLTSPDNNRTGDPAVNGNPSNVRGAGGNTQQQQQPDPGTRMNGRNEPTRQATQQPQQQMTPEPPARWNGGNASQQPQQQNNTRGAGGNMREERQQPQQQPQQQYNNSRGSVNNNRQEPQRQQYNPQPQQQQRQYEPQRQQPQQRNYEPQRSSPSPRSSPNFNQGGSSPRGNMGGGGGGGGGARGGGGGRRP